MTEHIESVIIQVSKESKLGIHPKLRWSSFSLKFLIKFTSSCIVDIYMNVKGNVEFMFLCNPQKSGASRVWITFLQIPDCTFLRADGSKVNKTYYHIWWCTYCYNAKSICVMNVQGNAQFIFLCNPKKSGVSRVWIIFLQVTQKILTKNVFHWLELITEILSFLQIFSVRKTATQVFL